MNVRHTQNRSAGVTLIEIIVYIAILVLLASALVTTFLSLSTVLLRNKTERELTESASVSLERMVRAMRSADTVNAGLSTLDTSPGVLTLTEGATSTGFSVSGGDVSMSINGVSQGPLTSDTVTVDELIFNRYVGTSTEMVRVTLTLSSHTKASSSTRTFYTSAVLRGSYE